MRSRRPPAGRRDKEHTDETSTHEERTRTFSRQRRRLACRAGRRDDEGQVNQSGSDRRGRGRVDGGKCGRFVAPAPYGRRRFVSLKRANRSASRPTPVALTAAVDRSRRLSEGAVIQGSVRARLLGIPLLRLDATLALMPAAISTSSSPLGAGNGLADAVRCINDGAEVLAEVRRSNGN